MVLSFETAASGGVGSDDLNLTSEIFSMLESKFLSGGYQTPKRIGNGTGGKICVLSIDGGGMRGIVAGKMLAYLEDALQRKSGNCDARVADYVDVAVGAGVGGAIASMLFANDGAGRPLCRAHQISSLLAHHGTRLFRRSWSRFCGNRFSTSSVEQIWPLVREMPVAMNFVKMAFNLCKLQVFKALFGSKTLKDTLKPLLIPCYDLSSSAPFLFSRADALETDTFDFNLWEICRATSATPGFFRPVKMQSIDGQTSCTAVDGGLVMNNPTVAAVTHVLNNKQEFPFVRGVEDLLVLSIGTGQFDRKYEYQTVKGWGAFQWAKPVMKIVKDGVSDMVDHALSMAFGQKPQNYVRIQANGFPEENLGDIDDPSPANVEMLMNFADNMLKQKSMEYIPFGGKKKLPQTNAERLDWFAEQLVLEHQSRASRTIPTVLLKQQSPRLSLTESF
ncbi:hypothetical protein KI387_032587 [Taxus chinensis]|uniref:Patatin n=1 Tax=Taxus chinensis TaxID=29808 RepID=A0AA38BPM2_TAXCH|nr:hypothetical protein KI387_032587 [Taxus chinensis]